MRFLVNFAFDLVAWISAFLDWALQIVTGGDSDLTAFVVAGLCGFILIGCYDLVVLGRRRARCAVVAFGPLLLLLIMDAVGHQSGLEVVTTLNADRVQRAKGQSYRYVLARDLAARLENTNWTMVSGSKGIFSRWVVMDSPHEKAVSIAQIEGERKAMCRLKGRYLWFSMPEGQDARSGAQLIRLVCDKGWLPRVPSFLIGCFIVSCSIMCVARFGGTVSSAVRRLFRDRLFLVSACVFMAVFGWHQSRFVHQDARMQMVTSRDDDGYMMRRLQEAVKLKTMDPAKLSNSAYGAIGFYPYAMLPYAAGHLGMTPSIEVINTWVRGLKLLISVGALGALWLLGRHHFGRVPAFAAVLLLATNMGFLSYSSYPFYPDILMVMFSTLSLRYLLDLVSGWNARSFLLSVFCAAMSVSVKFLTFLLFPFVFVIGAVALWRMHLGRPDAFLKEFVRCGLVAAVVCVAAFFLCNPYLDYNIQWIVPNYKMCGSYYSTETPNIVAGDAATWSDWIEYCFICGRDTSDLLFALVALGALAAVVIRRWMAGGSAWRSKGLECGRVAVLSVFAILAQAYVMRSVTLTSAIDQRLLLPLFPVFYLVAAWGTVRLFFKETTAGVKNTGTGWRRRAALGCVVVTVLLISTPARLLNAMGFLRAFGLPPADSPVSAWLDEAGIPGERLIVTSLQSYFPTRYQDLQDGLWTPRDLLLLFYQAGKLPVAFIEDETYYDEYFSGAVRARGFNTPEQKRLFERGSEFYQRLRSNKMEPFVLLSRGSEIVRTNSMTPIASKFRAYVNPYVWSENLTERAVMKVTDADGDRIVSELPLGIPGGISLQWPSPTTVALVHVSANRPDCDELHLTLENACGSKETHVVQGPQAGSVPATERFLRLDPPRDIRAMTFVSADGTPCGADLVRAVHTYPPVPAGLNPTGHYFDIKAVSHGNDPGLDALIGIHPVSGGGVEIPPGGDLSFSLVPKAGHMAERAQLVFKDAPPSGAVTVGCTFVFADGSRQLVDGVERRSKLPEATYFEFDCSSRRVVRTLEFSIRVQAAQRAGVTLMQVHAEASTAAE